MKAVSEAAHPQNGATARAVPETAAADATPDTVHDRHTGKMSAMEPGGAVTESDLELAMIADEGATTGEEAGTTAPASATAHHNHQKGHAVVLVAHSAALQSLQLVPAPQPTPSRKRHPMSR